jgi:putative ABC transport system ATP-binding protein
VDDGAAFVLAGVSLRRPGVGMVLHDIDLTVPAGRITAVVGPSGSGKSSLLRLLNRLDDPTAGWISYDGRPLGDYDVRDLRRRVGFVFQAPVLFTGTVADNLAVAAELAGLTQAGRDGSRRGALHGSVDDACRHACRAAELDEELLGREVDRLSGGERQRVTIARALVAAPAALLMDEPTSALDPATADRLVDTIRRMSRDAALTVVLVTHRHDEARRVSDLAVLLERGRIAAAGPTADVLTRTPTSADGEP